MKTFIILPPESHRVKNRCNYWKSFQRPAGVSLELPWVLYQKVTCFYFYKFSISRQIVMLFQALPFEDCLTLPGRTADNWHVPLKKILERNRLYNIHFVWLATRWDSYVYVEPREMDHTFNKCIWVQFKILIGVRDQSVYPGKWSVKL